MHVTRRAVLKAAGSATVGAVAGLAGYGYAYERHALRGRACGAAGLGVVAAA